MTDFAVLNVTARLDDFEPVHVSDSFARVRNRCADCFLDTSFRRTHDFEYFVYVIFHCIPRLMSGRSEYPKHCATRPRFLIPRKNNATRFRLTRGVEVQIFGLLLQRGEPSIDILASLILGISITLLQTAF
jgi:hypothetical protein